MFVLAETVKNSLKIAFLTFIENAKRSNVIDKTKKIKINNAIIIETKTETRDTIIIKTIAEKKKTSTEINIA